MLNSKHTDSWWCLHTCYFVTLEIQTTNGPFDAFMSLTFYFIFILDLSIVWPLCLHTWYEMTRSYCFSQSFIGTLGLLEKDKQKRKDKTPLCFLWFSEM